MASAASLPPFRSANSDLQMGVEVSAVEYCERATAICSMGSIFVCQTFRQSSTKGFCTVIQKDRAGAHSEAYLEDDAKRMEGQHDRAQRRVQFMATPISHVCWRARKLSSFQEEQTFEPAASCANLGPPHAALRALQRT